MLCLPLPTSPLRSLFSVSDLITLQSAGGRLSFPTFRPVVPQVQKALRAGDKAVKSANAVVMRASGEVWLIEIKRNSWRKLWNFGDPLR